MEVIQSTDAQTIQLSHRRFITNLYNKYKNDINNLIPHVSDIMPETPVLPPARAENPTKLQVKRFQEIIGSLMHPCVTDHPDVTHAVGVLSQYLIVPWDEHYLRALKVIKYLYHTQEWCLTFDATNTDHKVSDSIKLTTYVDANWGNDIEMHWSHTGFAIKLANGSVEYSSKLQWCVTLSSAESKYVALSAAVSAMLGINNMLKEVGFEVATPIIYEDNQSCITITDNIHSNTCTKHIDLHYHFSNEKVANGEIDLRYVKSESNVTDMFTKPLGPIEFQRQVQHIGMHPRVEEPQDQINQWKAQIMLAKTKTKFPRQDLRGCVERLEDSIKIYEIWWP